MKALRIFPFILLFSCMFYANVVLAVAEIDDNAPVVKLRYDDPSIADDGCMEAGTLLDNCFTTTSDLVDWIVNTRQPTASSRLIVEIGPGTFGPFELGNNAGGCWLTLRGSGRKHTIIDSGTATNVMNFTTSCNLDVESLTLKGSAYFIGGIFVAGGDGTGQTTWSDVEVLATSYAWTEQCTSSSVKHYWFNSRITAISGAFTRAYFAECGEHWFFGSEITSHGNNKAGIAIKTGASEIHVYGSVIRTITDPGVGGPGNTVTGIEVSSGGELHIHGTGIDMISAEANNLKVFDVKSNGKLHANVSAYNLDTSTGGTITRISKSSGGHAHAPYLWESHDTPPAVVNVNADGEDMAVEIAGTDINLSLIHI